MGTLRTPAEPSASSSALLSSTAPLADSALSTVSDAPVRASKRRKLGVPLDVRFAEYFAGDALLTSTMRAAGVTCLPPNDIESGGADFEDSSDVKAVREALRILRTADCRLILHFAPPCHTYSRARDRSEDTRLRSTDHPEGLPWLNAERQCEVDSGTRSPATRLIQRSGRRRNYGQ